MKMENIYLRDQQVAAYFFKGKVFRVNNQRLEAITQKHEKPRKSTEILKFSLKAPNKREICFFIAPGDRRWEFWHFHKL